MKTTLFDEDGNEMSPPDDCAEDEYYVLVTWREGSKWVKCKYDNQASVFGFKDVIKQPDKE